MALDAALATTVRKDNLNRDPEMREEEQEDMERGAGQWVNDDRTGEDNTAEEILMNETVPVRQDGDRIVLKKIRKAKRTDQLKWSTV